MKKFLLSILILILTIFLIWGYLYPYTKYQAKRNFNKYILEQNILNDNIDSLKEGWSYPKRMYLIFVKYKDQPGYKYIYDYDPNYKEPFNIRLYIEKDKSYNKNISNIKYPPLKK
jgi:hypothetical protein